jgi:hypothetical protein
MGSPHISDKDNDRHDDIYHREELKHAHQHQGLMTAWQYLLLV